MRSKVLAVVGLLTLGLAACGGSSSTTRNAEGDMVSCVSQADSKITEDGQLELHFCSAATSWIREDEGAIYSEKTSIENGIATTPLLGLHSMKVMSYDAQGKTLGIDKITINGARSGMIFDFDRSKNPAVFYEVAPINWTGAETEQKLTRPEFAESVTKLNNSTAPAGDWFIGKFSEMKRLLSNSEIAKAAGIVGGDRRDWYWVSNQKPEIDQYGAQRVAYAPRGFLSFFVVDKRAASEIRVYSRPIRTFTNGDGPVIIVSAGLSAESPSSSSVGAPDTSAPTADTVAPSSSVSSNDTLAPDTTNTSNISTPISETNEPQVTVEPKSSTPDGTVNNTIQKTTVTTSPTTTSPNVELPTNIISPQIDNIELKAEDQVVKLTPVEVRELLLNSAPEEIKSAEIQFDDGAWLPISVKSETTLSVPSTAKTANVRITAQSGSQYSFSKTISRSGTDVTTSTEPPTQEPTVAAPVAGSDNKSSNTTLFGAIGGVILLLVLGAGVMQSRRRKKSA